MKESVIKSFSFLFLTVLAPIHMTLGVVGLAILLDTVFGIWAARHKAREMGVPVREFITSRKLRVGLVSKLFVYQSTILLLFGLDSLILNSLWLWILPNFPIHFFATKALGLILVMIEFDSISESYYKVKGISLVQIIIKKLKFLKSIYKEVNEIKKDNGGGSEANS